MPEPVSPVILESQKYRAQLAARDAAATRRLIQAWGGVWERLQLLLEALLLEVGELPMSTSQLVKMQRYKSLMIQIADELRGLQALTQIEIREAVKLGIALGARNVLQLISIIIAGNLSVVGALNTLPVEQIETILGFLLPGSPLYERLKLMAPFTADAIANAIVEGVALGYNPRKIADEVRKAFGISLTDALRFVRTAQLWAYREANRANMAANSDVVEGWVWSAALDDRTCMGCIAMHGTIHPLSETLNDHHNGRCAPIPLVKGYDNPVDEIGFDWFAQQPEAVQRQMMGPGKYEAWKAGEFKIEDMVMIYKDDVYGEMRREATLKELLGE